MKKMIRKWAASQRPAGVPSVDALRSQMARDLVWIETRDFPVTPLVFEVDGWTARPVATQAILSRADASLLIDRAGMIEWDWQPQAFTPRRDKDLRADLDWFFDGDSTAVDGAVRAYHDLCAALGELCDVGQPQNDDRAHYPLLSERLPFGELGGATDATSAGRLCRHACLLFDQILTVLCEFPEGLDVGEWVDVPDLAIYGAKVKHFKGKFAEISAYHPTESGVCRVVALNRVAKHHSYNHEGTQP